VYDEVDDELRETAWYKELERQMEEERVRRVAAEEVRTAAITLAAVARCVCRTAFVRTQP
jgi:hypothetical protein